MDITEYVIDTWMLNDWNLLITGKSRSGKTTLLKEVLKRGAEKGVFVLPTFFCDGVSPVESRQEALALMLDFAVKELHDRQAGEGSTEPMIVAIDDWSNLKTLAAVKAVKKLLLCGLQYGIRVYLSSQSARLSDIDLDMGVMLSSVHQIDLDTCKLDLGQEAVHA